MKHDSGDWQCHVNRSRWKLIGRASAKFLRDRQPKVAGSNPAHLFRSNFPDGTGSPHGLPRPRMFAARFYSSNHGGFTILVLTRKKTERIQVGENIIITVLRINSSDVRIGIEAPDSTRIVRGEVEAKETKE